MGAVLNGILAVVYPIAVWLALTRFSARRVGLLLIAVLVPILILRHWRAERAHLIAVMRIPLVIVAVLLLGVLTDDSRFVLFMPVLVNLALLATFGASLRGEMPLIERFARMQESDLSAAKQAHCRQTTVAWCVFFVLNASVAAVLALKAPLSWWAAYNGGIAYGLMGAMFTGEYILRKYRFRDYGRGVHDRMLARVFPPRAESGS